MKIKFKIIHCYTILVVTFASLVIFPTPDKATLVKHHLSALGLRIVDLSLIVPQAIIWMAAFYGYCRLHTYSQLIRGSQEGHPIVKMARGLLLLALGMPVAAILANIFSIIAARYPSFKITSTIINNYVAIVFPLAAFIWLSMGARGLSQITKTRPPLRIVNLIIFVAITLGVVFCSFIELEHEEILSLYHMSPELVMVTMAIPYIYIWSLGLLAVAELYEYSRKIGGIVYRKGWKLLITGVTAIILLSIVLQYLTTFSYWLTSLSLSGMMLLLYTLLLLLTSAFIVVALGAQRLTKIENV